MTYPEYTKKNLADFSGRPEQSYTEYSTQAISQAVLLFKIGTCLAGLPEDKTKLELAEMGIMALADSIYLSQQYQAAAASPFSSESIGSYSYSKAARAVASGTATGIMWFDLAVSQLSECEQNDGIPTGGGIEVFEWDTTLTAGNNGNLRALGPADIELSRSFGYDPAPRGF